jgi:hypothetical protein
LSVNRTIRLDALCAVLLIAGDALVLWLAPFRSESYYIDWISGGIFGALVGASEGWLTITSVRERLDGSLLTLRGSRWGAPQGAGSAAVFPAILASAIALLLLWPGSAAAMTKLALYLFNTLCGVWLGLWSVYLGLLLVWSVRRRIRLSLTQAGRLR